MKNAIHVTFIILVAIIFTGCATIFKGTSQDIVIKSTPEKAHVTIRSSNGEEMLSGVTPISTKLPKKNSYMVSIKLDGYKQAIIPISQSLDGWFIGNLICGGIVGMIIDFADGAMWDLEPGTINVALLTAYLDGNDTQTYAVFRALDNMGQIRTLAVPLIKDNAQVAIK